MKAIIKNKCKEHDLGSFVKYEEIARWKSGRRYIVTTRRLVKCQYTFYFDEEKLVAITRLGKDVFRC